MSSNPIRDMERRFEDLSGKMEDLIEEEDKIYYKLRSDVRVPQKCKYCNSVYGYSKEKLSKKDRKVLEERLNTIELERADIEDEVEQYLDDLLSATIFQVSGLNY